MVLPPLLRAQRLYSGCMISNPEIPRIQYPYVSVTWTMCTSKSAIIKYSKSLEWPVISSFKVHANTCAYLSNWIHYMPCNNDAWTFEFYYCSRWGNVTISKKLLQELLPGPVTVVFERTLALNPELNPGTSLVGKHINISLSLYTCISHHCIKGWLLVMSGPCSVKRCRKATKYSITFIPNYPDLENPLCWYDDDQNPTWATLNQLFSELFAFDSGYCRYCKVWSWVCERRQVN